MRRARLARSAAAGLVALGALSGCGFGTGSGGTALALVGYAAPKAAHTAAQQDWQQTAAGDDVSWRSSYGASGDQSRAVAAGLETDLVHFSFEDDIVRLVDAGVVAEDWNAGPRRGIVSESVVVLVVRKGNPKNITRWDDLVKPGIGIVTPNPGSSGSARWNILAAWGQAVADGGSEADAKAYLTSFFANVAALPGSSRDATTAFTTGTGDVLISYENEAIFARARGEEFEYVVPDTTLLIENPAAVTVDADPAARSYLDYLHSAPGQNAFARMGFRPVGTAAAGGPEVAGVEVEGAMDPSRPFPAPRRLLTIGADFGGWSATNEKFFPKEGVGVISSIQKAAGKS